MFQYSRHRAVFQQDNPSSTPVFEAALPSQPSTLKKQTQACASTAIPKGCTETLELSGAEHLLRNPQRKVNKPFWIQHGSCNLGPAATEISTNWLNVEFPFHQSDILTLALIPYGKPALTGY